MRTAGYKPPKAARTLNAFVKIIQAGISAPEATGVSVTGDRWYASYGEHPHEVRFYSGTEFSYAGRTGNAQWRKGGKACEPINGSATVYFHDEPSKRYALLAFLVKAKAITRGEWKSVRETAQEAKMHAAADYAVGMMRAAQAKQQRECAEQAAVVEAELDALDVFETHDTSLSDLLCVRHKLMAKEPLYATQTQGRSDDRTG
ncbi:hypothetical protein [Burkholderia savannae]|uniref:hypothetical protein n=1 Tax=Burkholderia savannae TaxID=1637837 RepID=UPI0012F4C117|nr:hypothetical protein [Burkholderia savannae]